MRIQIFQITVSHERREANQEAIHKLANSISELGLLNPITVDQDYTLIAGLHRLEAAKLLGWTEIECMVSSLDGLLAELAEIDENFVRAELNPIDSGTLFLRRKEIYEILHPETKATYEGGEFRGNQHQKVVAARSAATTKSFIQDASEKTGKAPRTIREEIQIAKNLSSKAKDIIQSTNTRIKKKDAIKLSRLSPDQQEEAASQLAKGTIHSIDNYFTIPAEQADAKAQESESPVPADIPYAIGGRHFSSLEESIADLKNTNKDCSYTPDTLLADIDGFVATFHKNFTWYSDPFCTVVFPQISQMQFEYVRQRFSTISAAMENLINLMAKEINK